MDTNQLIKDFAAEQDRKIEAPVGENDKELLRKFAEYAKENGLLADCFYD